MGEGRFVLRRVAKDALKVTFDKQLKLKFHRQNPHTAQSLIKSYHYSFQP